MSLAQKLRQKRSFPDRKRKFLLLAFGILVLAAILFRLLQPQPGPAEATTSLISWASSAREKDAE